MDDEAERLQIDAQLAGTLIRHQFPQYAHMRLRPASSAGTDNAIFRLGDALAARLPVRESAAPQIVREQTWLPVLAPHLPMEIPEPVAIGAPAGAYPWPWSICRWIEGDDAASVGPFDLSTAAQALGGFLSALRKLDARGGPTAGVANHGRGIALARLDERVRRDVAQLADIIDPAAALATWEEALQASAWTGPGEWLHGDLHPGNLLVRQGRLVGVLDFGLLGVGDPAADLIVAWTLLDTPARTVFREATGDGADMWARGRGWAVFNAVIALAFYRERNQQLSAMARRTLTQLALPEPA